MQVKFIRLPESAIFKGMTDAGLPADYAGMLSHLDALSAKNAFAQPLVSETPCVFVEPEL